MKNLHLFANKSDLFKETVQLVHKTGLNNWSKILTETFTDIICIFGVNYSL